MYIVDYEFGLWFVFKGGKKLGNTASNTRESAEQKLSTIKNQVKK